MIGLEWRRTKIYTPVIKKYGRELQMMVAIEEMSELTKALIHDMRKNRGYKIDSIAEEIADVKIMLEQLEVIFSCSDLVEEQMQYKLVKLEKIHLT